jgi:sugar-specific transcriptional regulator TrmB
MLGDKQDLVDDHNIQALIRLGFTSNQAKVYLTLVSTRFSTVREIQKTSEVPRQEIYKILEKLQDMGLIERTLTRPIRYKAVPFQQGVRFLLNQKIEETKKLQKEADKIIANHDYVIHKLEVKENTPEFVLISKKEAYFTRRKKEIDNSQTSIDFLTPWKRFLGVVYNFENNAKRALERNVKIRVCLEMPKDLNDIPERIQSLKILPNFKLKYLIDCPPTLMAIFDKKKALIDTSSLDNITEATALWTHNNAILSILCNYFDVIWNTAIEDQDVKEKEIS